MTTATNARITWVTLGVSMALLSSAFTGARTQDVKRVDAETFAQAFYAGDAVKYQGFQVDGSGPAFLGANRDLSTVAVTVGVLQDKRVKPIATWDEFFTAESNRSSLNVSMRTGTGFGTPGVLNASAGRPPVVYEFSGTYLGQTYTMARMDRGSGDPDAGPCPGEDMSRRASSNPNPAYYCMPVLVNARISPKQ